MAIPYPLAELICHENNFRTLPKKILCLGRQTICFSEDDLMQLAHKFKISLEGEIVSLDTRTIYAKQNPERRFIDDKTFFGIFGVDEIDVIDHSDFEGANIICDICGDIPDNLCGRYDFIFNGSVLDNVWNPSRALQNISRLLAPGGRVLTIETATACRYNYSAISPSWYLDYYAFNRFRDCKIYYGVVDDISKVTLDPWQLLAFKPKFSSRANAFSPGIGDKLGISIVIAEKASDSTFEFSPIQSYYRSDEDWNEFEKAYAHILECDRPFFLGDAGSGEWIAGHEETWVTLGWWGRRNY